MKVIKKGNNTNRLWISECYVCGAILTAFENELKITIADYRSDYEDFASMICPECDNNTIFYRIEQKTGKKLYETYKHLIINEFKGYK